MVERFRILAALAALALLLTHAPGATAAFQLRLGEHSFDWTTVEQERAHFRWNAEVTNATGRNVRVTVTVDLLDDDDSVVHSDSTTVEMARDATQRVRHEGSLPFDRAADVVTFRFRLAPEPAHAS